MNVVSSFFVCQPVTKNRPLWRKSQWKSNKSRQTITLKHFEKNLRTNDPDLLLNEYLPFIEQTLYNQFANTELILSMCYEEHGL